MKTFVECTKETIFTLSPSRLDYSNRRRDEKFLLDAITNFVYADHNFPLHTDVHQQLFRFLTLQASEQFSKVSCHHWTSFIQRVQNNSRLATFTTSFLFNKLEILMISGLSNFLC